MSFMNCFNLKRVTLPESVVRLEKGAFANCFNLEHIDISNVERIEYCCFACCSSLKSITISKDRFKEGSL